MIIDDKKQIKETTKLQKVLICAVTKKNESYAININEYPEKICLIVENIAIDLEMNCYYDYIKIPGYKNFLSVLNTRFSEYESKKELLFCLSNNANSITINTKEQLEKIKSILIKYQNGEIPYINDYLTPEQYKENTKQL